jgi:hypothetical protein
VFYNAARFPPEPVDNISDPARLIVQEALRVDIFRSKDCDLGAWPDRTEEVQGGVGAVRGEWVMILPEVSTPLCERATYECDARYRLRK